MVEAKESQGIASYSLISSHFEHLQLLVSSSEIMSDSTDHVAVKNRKSAKLSLTYPDASDTTRKLTFMVFCNQLIVS